MTMPLQIQSGKALILVIAESINPATWILLDFGEGAESYKYDYTNKEMEVNEISISTINNVSFIIKSKMRQVFREKISRLGLKKFIKEKIKPLTQKGKN